MTTQLICRCLGCGTLLRADVAVIQRLITEALATHQEEVFAACPSCGIIVARMLEETGRTYLMRDAGVKTSNEAMPEPKGRA